MPSVYDLLATSNLNDLLHALTDSQPPAPEDDPDGTRPTWPAPRMAETLPALAMEAA